ncbi:hypothetical protein QWY16_01450 [Planococcus shenhongbingii]|uniref:YfhD family protein n=1 Tax=Planococcus shenhongbingii TaxID=3058398 RepID=A0ABT8NFX7_9BACL|nr:MULTISPECIES: hypothetical protein [unclassified Planococcus (in: firmicutes)]MDN7246794.1 hypothetical protein [Planococcus sp. N017]WKA58848.1 hypothetical protein QWY16_01450 [Planococcus sp. N016]
MARDKNLEELKDSVRKQEFREEIQEVKEQTRFPDERREQNDLDDDKQEK